MQKCQGRRTVNVVMDDEEEWWIGKSFASRFEFVVGLLGGKKGAQKV